MLCFTFLFTEMGGTCHLIVKRTILRRTGPGKYGEMVKTATNQNGDMS